MKEVGHHQAGKACLSRSSVSLCLDDLGTPHRGDYASAVMFQYSLVPGPCHCESCSGIVDSGLKDW
jgi:hypothetical protein